MQEETVENIPCPQSARGTWRAVICILAARDFPSGSDDKEPACNAGNLGSIPGLGRSSGGGHGNPLRYSCLESSMDRGAWWATVHPWGLKELDTTKQLSTPAFFR